MPIYKDDVKRIVSKLESGRKLLGPGRLSPGSKELIGKDMNDAIRMLDFILGKNGVRLYYGGAPTFSMGERPHTPVLLDLLDG